MTSHQQHQHEEEEEEQDVEAEVERQHPNPGGFKGIFLNDKFILLLISLNALIIFMQGFKAELDPQVHYILFVLDNIFSIIFVVEMSVKIAHYGFKDYWKVTWNKFDFTLIILSLPSIVMLVVPLENFINVSYLLVFRVFRVFKFFRFIQFFPQVEHIFRSVQQAMKASVMVLLGFFVVIFIMSILCCFFYQDAAPAMFGNPIKAYYSTFQVFTIEGWNAIPDALLNADAQNPEPFIGTMGAFFTKMFFIALFILGGVFGLSIVNSIFVDAMISDNEEEKDELKKLFDSKTEELKSQISVLLEKLEKMEQSQQNKG